MTLQTSGPISFTDLQTEFGGSNPVSLNEYYNGGGIVPAGTAAGTGSFSSAPLSSTSPSAIPASGGIQMSQFYGTMAFNPVSSSNMSSSASVVTGDASSHTCTAQVTWSPDGTTHSFRNNGAGGVITGHSNWYTPTTTDIGHTYYVMTDITSESQDIGGVTSTPSSSNVSGQRTTWTLLEATAGSGNGVTLSLTVTSPGNQEKGFSANGHLYFSTSPTGSPLVATWTWGLVVLISS